MDAVSGTMDRLEYKMERLTQKVARQSSPQASPFKRAGSKLNQDVLAGSFNFSAQRDAAAERGATGGLDTMRSPLSSAMRSPLGTAKLDYAQTAGANNGLMLAIGDIAEANRLSQQMPLGSGSPLLPPQVIQ